MSAVLCLICQDYLTQHNANSILTCGHAFHRQCAANWMQCKQTCPHCQTPVQNGQMSQIFLSFHDDVSIIVKLEQNLAVKTELEQEIQQLKDKIHQLETNVKTGQNLKAKNDELEKLTKEQADKISHLKSKQQSSRNDENLTKSVLDLAVELGELRQRCKDFDEKYHSLMDKLDASQQKVKQLEAENEEKRQAMYEKSVEYQTKCKEYDDVVAELLSLKRQIDEVRAMKSICDQELERRATEITELIASNSSHEREVQRMRIENDSLQCKLKRVHYNAQQLQNTIADNNESEDMPNEEAEDSRKQKQTGRNKRTTKPDEEPSGIKIRLRQRPDKHWTTNKQHLVG